MSISNPISPAMRARLRSLRIAETARLRSLAGDAFPLARFIPAEGNTVGPQNDVKGAVAAGTWTASRPDEAWLAMPSDLHAAAMLHALRHAARGRIVGILGRKGSPTVDVALPDPHFVEDHEAAADAVAFTWRAVQLGKVKGNPLPFLCGVARRMGKRREQHRIRERSNITEGATDRTVPDDCLALSDAELATRTEGTLRASFGHRFVRAASASERKRAAKEAQTRWRRRSIDPAELERLREVNARADATDEPWGVARLEAIARARQ